MLHNDISNRQAPIICFDANVLFSEVRTANSIKSFFCELVEGTEVYKFFNRTADFDAIKIIDKVWYGYDFSIYIAVDNPTITQRLTEFLDENDVDYTRIFEYQDIEHLRAMCNNRFHLYVSKNEEHISTISTKNAILLQDLPKHIKLARN